MIASRLDVDVRVTAIAPMSENMPGERAMKPGDVLTIRNGMTIEVLNTDAEGRLILADGLSLAVEAKPDAIDRRGHPDRRSSGRPGSTSSARCSPTDELADDCCDGERAAAANSSGGCRSSTLRVAHRLRRRRHEEHRQAAGAAGTISAALLLQRFTDGRPWAHLDIAGPGRADKDVGYLSKGATAFGLRPSWTYFDRAPEAQLQHALRTLEARLGPGRQEGVGAMVLPVAQPEQHRAVDELLIGDRHRLAELGIVPEGAREGRREPPAPRASSSSGHRRPSRRRRASRARARTRRARQARSSPCRPRRSARGSPQGCVRQTPPLCPPQALGAVADRCRQDASVAASK